MSRPALHIAPCSHAAALYACREWHYSGSIPIGKVICYGAWEADRYCGAIVFCRGASPKLLARYNLEQIEGCELGRVAMRSHESPISQMLSVALKLLKRSNRGLRLVVSFADPNQGHMGTIYRAGNWIYAGETGRSKEVRYNGKWLHERMLRRTGWGTTPRVARLSSSDKSSLNRRTRLGKHRYLMPLDRAMRRKVDQHRKPYPKRAGSIDSDAAITPDGKGGANPTPALCTSGAEL